MRVLLGGLGLNCQIDGPDGADWIVLSNSLGSDLSMWDDQIAFLTGRYRVLRYDTRGHGGSDAPPGPYRFAHLTADVLGLLDHFGIETAAFMGLSMGGMTGLGLAIDHPDRVHRLVCADGRADAPEAFRAMWDDRISKVETGGLSAIVDGTLASWLTDDWRAANPDRLSRLREMVLNNDPAGYVACCHAIKELDYLRRLGDVTIPLLYVGGRQDLGAAPEVMQAMADATPGGRYVAIENAAHVANINAVAPFNAAIDDFLGISEPARQGATN